MGLLDEIQRAQSAPQQLCKTGRLLLELPETDADDLRAAIDNPAIHSQVIVRVLNNRGHAISKSQFAVHRKKECCCVTSG